MKVFLFGALLVWCCAGVACHSAVDVPRNPRCVPFRQVRFSHAQTKELESFLAYQSDGVVGVKEAGPRPDYRSFCYRFVVQDGTGQGLLRITTYNRSHWGARLVVKTPQHLLLVSDVPLGPLRTYTTNQVAAACQGQLSERACAEIAERIQNGE